MINPSHIYYKSTAITNAYPYMHPTQIKTPSLKRGNYYSPKKMQLSAIGLKNIIQPINALKLDFQQTLSTTETLIKSFTNKAAEAQDLSFPLENWLKSFNGLMVDLNYFSSSNLNRHRQSISLIQYAYDSDLKKIGLAPQVDNTLIQLKSDSPHDAKDSLNFYSYLNQMQTALNRIEINPFDLLTLQNRYKKSPYTHTYDIHAHKKTISLLNLSGLIVNFPA